MLTNDSPYGVTFFTFDPVHGTLPDQLVTDMKALGLTWLRYQLPWSFIEQKPGVYTWTALDNVVTTCNSNNINICYVIEGSPQFYDQQPGYHTGRIVSGGNTGSTSITLRSVPSYLSPNTSIRLSNTSNQSEIVRTARDYSTGANPIKLASPITGSAKDTVQWYLYPDPLRTKVFAEAVALRYNGASGHGSIQAFEIGNEEYDSAGADGGAPDAYEDRHARYYIPVLSTVSPAIRKVYPDVLIGMCAIWWNHLPHITDFLEDIYLAGLKDLFDYVNFHFYPFESGASGLTTPTAWAWAAQPGSTVPSFAQEWQALLEVMHAHKDEKKAIWCTEFGWYANTNQPERGTTNLVSEETQSTNYRFVLENARQSDCVTHLFFWTLDYAPDKAAMHRDQNGNPFSDAYSLAQVQYGKPVRYTPAFTGIKEYIARYPQWGAEPEDPHHTLLHIKGTITVDLSVE